MFELLQMFQQFSLNQKLNISKCIFRQIAVAKTIATSRKNYFPMDVRAFRPLNYSLYANR